LVEFSDLPESIKWKTRGLGIVKRFIKQDHGDGYKLEDGRFEHYVRLVPQEKLNQLIKELVK
jgi:hypothetical protein